MLVFSPRALRNIEAIRHKIAQNNPHFAAGFRRMIIQKCDRLADFPRSGKVIDEFGTRALIVSPWIIKYDIWEDGTAVVLQVVDGRRENP